MCLKHYNPLDSSLLHINKQKYNLNDFVFQSGSQSDTLQSVYLEKQNIDECAAIYAEESAVAITDSE